jgi:hypothetical protein
MAQVFNARVELMPDGRHSVLVDGHDIGAAVTSVSVEAEAHRPPQLTIKVPRSRVSLLADLAGVEIIGKMSAEDADDFELLSDTITKHANPPDEDASCVWIMMQAVKRLAEAVETMTCACPAGDMGDSYGPDDACMKCRALGRFGGTLVQR